MIGVIVHIQPLISFAWFQFEYGIGNHETNLTKKVKLLSVWCINKSHELNNLKKKTATENLEKLRNKMKNTRKQWVDTWHRRQKKKRKIVNIQKKLF